MSVKKEPPNEFLDKDKHPFHPRDSPYGSKNYDAKALEPEQQEMLDQIKLNQRQYNEAYLNSHPEIRGLISIILRHLLDKKVTSSQEIQLLLVTFFERPRNVIATELLDYFLEMNFEGPIMDSLKEEISASDRSSEI